MRIDEVIISYRYLAIGFTTEPALRSAFIYLPFVLIIIRWGDQ